MPVSKQIDQMSWQGDIIQPLSLTTAVLVQCDHKWNSCGGWDED